MRYSNCECMLLHRVLSQTCDNSEYDRMRGSDFCDRLYLWIKISSRGHRFESCGSQWLESYTYRSISYMSSNITSCTFNLPGITVVACVDTPNRVPTSIKYEYANKIAGHDMCHLHIQRPSKIKLCSSISAKPELNPMTAKKTAAKGTYMWASPARALLR